MKKFSKIALSIILVMAISTSLFLICFADSYDSYEGYIPISSITDLYNIRNDLDGKYVLTNDIDLLNFISVGFYTPFEGWSPTNTWIPIGTSDEPFTGVLDGNGYSIENLSIKIDSESSIESSDLIIGIFGVVKDGVVANLNVSNVNIDINRDDAYFSIGTVAGVTYNSQIYGCSSSGNIQLTYYNYDVIYNGGIVGYLSENTIISNCANKTNIKITQIQKEESDNDFSFGLPAIADSGFGGISGGGFRTNLSKCINYGTITAETIGYGNFGGIVGLFDSNKISDCANVGDISVTGNHKYIGGICGFSNSITNCYNAGRITANESLEKIGAISGKAKENTVFTNCYYDNQLSNAVSTPEDCLLYNVKVVTSEDLKTQKTFEGFDFENIWSIIENGYPTPFKKMMSENKIVEIVSCEITDVPFKNSFCTSENISPEGISIKLIYSNNSEVTHKVTCEEGRYYVSGEEVTVSVENNRAFGIVKVNLSLLDTDATYRCFVFPSIFSIIIDAIVSILNR